MYTRTKNLPDYIHSVLKAANFKKHELEVVETSIVSVLHTTSLGVPAYNILVDLSEGTHSVLTDDSAGIRRHTLAENEAIIHGRSGKRAWAILYVHPNSVSKFVQEPVSIGQDERNVLLIYRCSTGDDRENALRQARRRDLSEQLLMLKKLIVPSTSGIRVTTAGKNALEATQ